MICGEKSTKQKSQTNQLQYGRTNLVDLAISAISNYFNQIKYSSWILQLDKQINPTMLFLVKWTEQSIHMYSDACKQCILFMLPNAM